MKYRLELQRPVEGDSTFGSEPMKFIVTKTVHAEPVKISALRTAATELMKLASTSLTTP